MQNEKKRSSSELRAVHIYTTAKIELSKLPRYLITLVTTGPMKPDN